MSPASKPRAMKILILSASAGAGHVRAADALLKEFARRGDIAAVEHWDMLKYTTRVFRHLYSKVYLDLINRAPAVLGWVYNTMDTPWKGERKRLLFERFNARPFLKAVTAYKPDLIVCTHFTPAVLVAYLFERDELNVPPAIVITDFDCHAMWLTHSYQRYFVALPETKVYLDKLGIDRERINVTGIPIDPVFREPKNKIDMRVKLGLKPDRTTIMVSAGGFGVGPIEGLIKELLHISHPAQIVAIAGKSEALKAKLDILAKNVKGKLALHTVGFTTAMDEYMAASDVLVSKPGGLTVSEAMARGLPMCIVNAIPGQEERNSDHLLEAAVAIKCNNLPTLAYKIDQLIGDEPRLKKMHDNALAFGRPKAAESIVTALLS